MATNHLKIKNPLTDAAIRKFMVSDAVQLSCNNIAGFHLFKTKNGASWRYRYTDLAGDRQLYTVGRYPAMSYAEAYAALEQARAESGGDPVNHYKNARNRAVREKQAAASRTVRAYLEGPYTEHQSRKKHGGRHNLGIITQNFGHLMGRDMLTLSADDIHVWQAKREAEGLAYATIERAFRQFKTMVKHAYDNERLPENPLQSVKLKDTRAAEKARAAEHKADRRLLTAKELAGIQKGLSKYEEELRRQRRNSRAHGKPDLPDLDTVAFACWFTPFCLLALHTGMRPGDLYTLTWTELNLNFRRIDKIPEKTLHHRNPAQLNLYLDDDITEIMKAWHQQQGKPLSGLVFPSPVNGGPMDKKAHGAHWEHVKRLGGLGKDLAFYSLRHHFISRLVTDNVPLLTVAKLVGHKSAAMIEKHYSHLCPTQAKDVLQAYAKKLRVMA